MSSPSQLSFLPDDYLERKARRRTNAVCAVLFIMVVGGIVTVFTITDKALREARAENAVASREYAEAAKPIQQFQQLQEKQRTMANQAELTSSLLEKVPRSFLLAEITNAMPGGMSLLDLVMESRVRVAAAPVARTAFEQRRIEAGGAAAPAAAAAPQAKLYNVGLKLTGMAATDLQVAQFISKLNASSLLKDVNLVVSEEFTQQDEKLRKFQIEMQVNPNAEVETLQPRSSKTASVELPTPGK